MMKMKTEKHKHNKRIILPKNKEIKEKRSEPGYKYLELLGTDGVKNQQGYLVRVKEVFKSKQNGVNSISRVNINAVIRYSIRMIKWTVKKNSRISTEKAQH